jgi:hypothetical protein
MSKTIIIVCTNATVTALLQKEDTDVYKNFVAKLRDAVKPRSRTI